MQTFYKGYMNLSIQAIEFLIMILNFKS